MKWPIYWLHLLCIHLVSTTSCVSRNPGRGWTTRRKAEARETTRRLWYHGFDNYMRHAFPLDELSPLSCAGRGPDWENPANIAYNDVSGNFSLTLIDVLDTLIVLNDRPGFELAVRNIIDSVSFDVNTRPQVFETTIRVLGGLLSGHIFATQQGRFHIRWYRGELLTLAHDLGKRLLPAFATPTGIPYARLNLRHGVPKGETTETCTAGAGSLMLEFATLSRLTGDERFEKAAYKAFFALWNRKSNIGLVGNTIDTWAGTWTSPEVTGIGAGVDSFYEYAFKWYVLSGEVEFLDVFLEAYSSIMRYARSADGFRYKAVNIHTGDVAYHTVDSLSAFWPGLQVLSGDLQNAIKAHQLYWNLWRRHSGLPEVWDGLNRVATSFNYPLRPEFIESTWYLYRATRDSFYLDVGERILSDISVRAKVECGLAGIKDLRVNSREDRMDSFALSETLKYLYLLFDEDNSLHSDDSNYVFTTEGHILILSESLKPMSAARRKMRQGENHSCPAYLPVFASYDARGEGGLVQGIKSRPDVDYARELASIRPGEEDMYVWESHGWCEMPKVDLPSYEFVLSVDGKVVTEDVNPGPHKLVHVQDGYIVQNVSGIRVHIVTRLDGKGFDIVKLGPHSVKRGQTVYINDTTLRSSPSAEERDKDFPREPQVALRFSSGAGTMARAGAHDTIVRELSVVGSTGFFGGDLNDQSDQPLRFGHGEGVRVVRFSRDSFGCSTTDNVFDGAIVLVRRGECTFLEKLLHARDAGSSGIVVISDEEQGVNPSADAADLAAAGELDNVAIVLLTKSDGASVAAMMDSIEADGNGEFSVVVQLERQSSSREEGKGKTNKILYLNGHPLHNTRFLF